MAAGDPYPPLIAPDSQEIINKVNAANAAMLERISEGLIQFGKEQEALIVRYEAKIDNLEQMFATMVAGYADVAAMCEALVEERLQGGNPEAFGAVLVAKRAKILEALQTGIVDAEDNFERFAPLSTESPRR